MKPWFRKKRNFKYEILAAAILIIATWVFFFLWWSNNIYLFIAAILGLYMAINIWANDVANNMWPAVWSKAMTITWAIIIAAIFEAAWVMIAWWDVVNTISKWIIDPALISDSTQFIAIMMATLAWAALWVNIATFLKAPVSTTHSIVWWLIWAWITAVWVSIVDWYQVWMIAASWIISPLMWWVIAVILLLSIRKNILKQDERWDSAKIWVPIYIWLMIWAFSTYLMLKWLKQVLNHTDYWFLLKPEIAIFVWYVLAVLTFILLRIYYKKQSSYFKNSKHFINKLFNIPLIFAVSLLSFAHWANDVANAIWPLAAINDAIKNHLVASSEIWIETWVMLIWAIWLVLWLGVFWSRLIKTVWSEITKLNQISAYCVALAAAITVIVASQLGLPVSSTHIALGWVFWVWLLREHIKRQKWKTKDYIEKDMIKSIALAWVVTLPASWIIAALTYLLIMKLS
jgi:PiT family inorganic phosphate transporter